MSLIGIDLGTTNCVVATVDNSETATALTARDGNRVMPSVVHFDANDGTTIGHVAKSMAVLEPERVAMLFKRGMGETTFLADGSEFTVDGTEWRPEALSSLLLKKLKETAEESLNESVEGAVVTVPAYFGELERKATQEAAELAGLPLLRLINEPTAAAIAHGIDNESSGQKIMVFDLGGGTFDVTVMAVGDDIEMEVIATGGDPKLGGADFDELIVEEMAAFAMSEANVDILSQAWMFADAKEKAEEIKKELSTREQTTKPLSTGGQPLMFEYSRVQFEDALEDILEDVSDTIDNTLDDADLSESDIDVVLMVGGSSRIPAFAELMRTKFGRDPLFSTNLDEDVARGAAILAAKVGGGLDPKSELAMLAMPTDVASHGVGLSILDSNTDTMYNSILIPAGTPLPASNRDQFVAAHQGQTEVRLEVNEGNESDLEYCRPLGESTAFFGRPVAKGHPINIEVTYNDEQIVHLFAYDGVSEDLIGEVRLERTGSMSELERSDAQTRISRMDVK